MRCRPASCPRRHIEKLRADADRVTPASKRLAGPICPALGPAPYRTAPRQLPPRWAEVCLHQPPHPNNPFKSAPAPSFRLRVATLQEKMNMKISEQMLNAIAAYNGPVTRCPPGEARAKPPKNVADGATRWLRQHRHDQPATNRRAERRWSRMARARQRSIAKRNAAIKGRSPAGKQVRDFLRSRPT